MNLYLDSSALLRQYLNRKGATETDAVRASAAEVGVASVTRVEVAAALNRLSFGGGIEAFDASRALGHLDDDLLDLWEIPINDDVLQRAYTLALRHRLKGYDAVQLAAASCWQEALGSPLTLATFDALLWAAAQAEGFTVWPPDLTLFK